RPPALVMAVAVAGAALFLAPIFAITWRAPWARAWHVLGGAEGGEAPRPSAGCSLRAPPLALRPRPPPPRGLPPPPLPGPPLARPSRPAPALARSLRVPPLPLPPVVGGVALLYAFGRFGVVGQYLDRWWGWHLAFTTPGVILAETFVAMPFFVVTVEAALRAL